MDTHDEVINPHPQTAMKRWYWPVLILGSLMVAGGVISVLFL